MKLIIPGAKALWILILIFAVFGAAIFICLPQVTACLYGILAPTMVVIIAPILIKRLSLAIELVGKDMKVVGDLSDFE